MRVRVAGLFGIFDHVIPLNLSSGITVVHGSNGVGKTIVLRMIHELMTGAPDVLLRVPYEQLELQFQSGDAIRVRPTRAPKDARVSLVCDVLVHSRRTLNIPYSTDLESDNLEQLSSMFNPWEYQGHGRWRDPRDGEITTTDDLTRRYLPPGTPVPKVRPLSPLIDQFTKKSRVRLIGTDRLTTSRQQSVHRPPDEITFGFGRVHDVDSDEDARERTIAVYSRDLIHRIRRALTAYGELTEVLDRSLVRRLISREQAKKTPEQLLALFKDLDVKRRRLTSLGVLNVAEDVLGEGATDDEVIDLVSNSTDVFSLYVHDMQQKLALFDELQEKLEILRGRTDKLFQFKKLMFDAEKGFEFKSDTGATVAAGDLSSGEQHEMILLYELLFLSRAGDLVLIDEPELSLHVEWQMELLDDLRAVLRASNIDVLMATHSPAIARGAKDDLIALGV